MQQPTDIHSFWKRSEISFREQHATLWPGLSRAVNLLAVLNISLFFLTDAVRTGGYYFPVISLSALALATLLMLLPLGWHNRLGFYLIVLAVCAVAAWLLGASILYWIQTGASA